jgi:hypothetical protein
VLSAIEESGANVESFTTEDTSLEDLFIQYAADEGQMGRKKPMETESDMVVKQ